MKIKWEHEINSLSAIVFFFGFLFISYKYVNLRSAYKQAETDKVYYCKEYHKLKCNEK